MQRYLLALALVLNLAHADTFVVCVGVEKYDDERISALRYAVGDAKAVATAFRNSGVPYRNVTLLTSDETDPSRRSTRANLLRTLGQIREQSTAEDRLVLFFAGHGLEQAGEQFLLTADTQRSLLADTALPMSLPGPPGGHRPRRRGGRPLPPRAAPRRAALS